MNANELTALQDEPACAHNRKSKSGCARAIPGATQGGCAFDGARNALIPIADAAHIVHGPIGCAGSSWDNRGSRSSGADLYRIGMTTDLSEMDVIMGRGEQRLLAAIHQAIKTYRPAAVFIYNTCVPALHGDDVAAVAKTALARWQVPVVPVDCAGFYGNKNLGNRIAGNAIVKHVIGTREPDPIPEAARRPGIQCHDVNLIGEWNVGGEFWNVAPLFDELGLRILCTLSGDARFREVQTMHRAAASMVVCSKAMLAVARHLHTDFSSPYFEGSFYGVQDTSEALRGFARLLGDPDLAQRTEALIAREEAAIDAQLAPLRARLAGKRAFVFTGGYKSWSIVSAMQDLGMEVVATGTEKSTEEDKARILALMGPDARMIADNDQVALLRAFHECRADIMVAGDRYIFPTLKSRLPFLDLDHVRNVGYAGFRGMVELARNLVIAIDSPIWRLVSKSPVWQRCDYRPTATPEVSMSSSPRIIHVPRALAVNPLKVSQPVGASLPFLGIAQAMPLEHGARGCTSFNKLFFMRHFREPIPLQTTAMDQLVTVMGADDNVVAALHTVWERHRPDVIGLISTGLSETQGADIPRTIKVFRQAHPECDATAVVPVSASDSLGCLETGFALAVEAIIRSLVPNQPGSKIKTLRQVTVLVGSMLTPGDIEALKEWIEAFGLHPVVLPDIGDSLDGHLIDEGYATLTYGGISRRAITRLGESAATLVIGASLHRAADLLKERTGVQDYRFAGLMGLDDCDAFTQVLSSLAGRAVPARIERQRSQLQDALVDCHFQLGGARVALAADADLLASLTRFFAASGVETVAAVASAKSDSLSRLPLEQVTIGDLADLEQQAKQSGAQLLVANSHGAEIASRLAIPLLRAGFPLYDQAGAHLRQWIGYRGSRQTIFELANAFAAHYQEITPYRSIYWEGTPRASESKPTIPAHSNAPGER